MSFLKNGVLLTDCLTNCDTDCTATFENSDTMAEGTVGEIYGRGIVNGAVSALMSAMGIEFLDALRLVKAHSHKTAGAHGVFNINCVPAVWREEWEKL